MKKYNHPKRKIVNAKKYISDITDLVNIIHDLTDANDDLVQDNIKQAKEIDKLKARRN